MSDPVTVFLLVVAGILVVGTLGEGIFRRTGVPAVIWLVLLGILVRISGIVPEPVIAGLAPFFAALALVIVLFDAGTTLSVARDDPALPATTRRHALVLAIGGFCVTLVVVALFSQALAGLKVLPSWSWGHAWLLATLLACTASEVFLPSLPASAKTLRALLDRESALTKMMAVVGTTICLALLSPQIASGDAGLAMLAGFGFALIFGCVAGLLWLVILQQLSGNNDNIARNYGFTLAVMLVLYVLSEAAGSAGPLSVLIFGVVLGNARLLLRMLRRGAEEDHEATAAIQDTLGGHNRTLEFVRTLMFAMVGLTLARPWGPIVMGIALGCLLVVARMFVVRFAVPGLKHHDRSIIAACAPRGMATVALATLPLAQAIPSATAVINLVFAATTTTIVLFTLGVHNLRNETSPQTPVAPPPRPAKPVAPVPEATFAVPAASEPPAKVQVFELPTNAPTAAQVPAATPFESVTALTTPAEQPLPAAPTVPAAADVGPVPEPLGATAGALVDPPSDTSPSVPEIADLASRPALELPPDPPDLREPTVQVSRGTARIIPAAAKPDDPQAD